MSVVTTSHATTLPTQTDPRNVSVDAKFLMARWGKQSSALYAYIERIDGFPHQVAPAKWRFDHILAIEDAIAAGTVTIRPSKPWAAEPSSDDDEPDIDEFRRPKTSKKTKTKVAR